VQDFAYFHRQIATIVIDEESHPEQSLELIQHGVAYVVERPLNLRHFSALIDRLTVYRRMSPPEVNDSSDIATEVTDDCFRLSPVMQTLQDQATRFANCDANVLILGETGVGKSYLARQLHDLSCRSDSPFIKVSCASLTPDLAESELFGHKHGAFTGAISDRRGAVASAEDGTLILDDVDTLPLQVQPKLLQVLDDHEFRPVGADKAVPMRARLIATSNRPLHQDVAAGKFRQDLYYRLCVLELNIPPIRERGGELPSLFNKLLANAARDVGCKSKTLCLDARQALLKYSWPGNVRELANCIQVATVAAQGDTIRFNDLAPHVQAGYSFQETDCSERRSKTPAFSPASSVAEKQRGIRNTIESPLSESNDVLTLSDLDDEETQLQRQHVLTALRESHNNRSKAAQTLGISRAAFYKLLHRVGLT
jgi:DNA-binding NtrC family response regulator